ncbi:rho guanine nucleotide exchange factor 25-like isoform X1 [Labeo rohita]|uniref:Rho guanine nucleotide exchange factor 25-like isoform X1 n=1 Tax=Labeo rohita TaxID=84645 RepID=A0A498LTI7_LABRO|nr:rho guanine nucleotide exchange factor 25-like isoform X1 [Labeo rohita]
MKSLPKNQGRTDQILGAMADMLTSLAIPNQKWSSEGIEHLSVTQEQKTGKQRPWDTEGLNWDDMSRDSLERVRRRDRAISSLMTYLMFVHLLRLVKNDALMKHVLLVMVVIKRETVPLCNSYSAAGSEGSISTSVASLPPQASGSSAPNSPGSRRSVSTLKKWLTNPVRKLSSGATGTAKGERQVRRLEGKPPPPPARSSQDLGSPQTEEQFTILPVIDKELEWRDGLNALGDCELGVQQSYSFQSDSPQGSTTLGQTQRLTHFYWKMVFNYLVLVLFSVMKYSVTSCLSPCYPPLCLQITQCTSLQADDNGSALMDDNSSQSSATIDSEEDRKSALEKSMYVLKELIETEKLYVADLGLIVEGYMATMNTKGVPEDMKGKDKIVFGNIHQIYDWHKE